MEEIIKDKIDESIKKVQSADQILSVTVSMSVKEYQDLKRDQKMLEALEAAGVDNWEGYPDAMEIFEQNKE
jgi:ribosomal protein S2